VAFQFFRLPSPDRVDLWVRARSCACPPVAHPLVALSQVVLLARQPAQPRANLTKYLLAVPSRAGRRILQAIIQLGVAARGRLPTSRPAPAVQAQGRSGRAAPDDASTWKDVRQHQGWSSMATLTTVCRGAHPLAHDDLPSDLLASLFPLQRWAAAGNVRPSAG